LVLGDLVALLFCHGSSGLSERSLQFRRRVDVFDLPARRADKVVVVPRELLGELESPMVVGPRDPAHDPYLYECRHVAISAALGELRR